MSGAWKKCYKIILEEALLCTYATSNIVSVPWCNASVSFRASSATMAQKSSKEHETDEKAQARGVTQDACIAVGG